MKSLRQYCGVIFNRLAAEAEWPRYLYCRIMRRPYFGRLMMAGITWRARIPHMRQALAAELRATGTREFRILEVGSWAGQSASLWASELKDSGRTGCVFCVDAWKPFVKAEHIGQETSLKLMNRALARDRIFSLFWHNTCTQGLADVIIPLRGWSHEILPCLRENIIDFAFIDASHAYSDVLQDLRRAAPLIKEGGVICGDDLEMQKDEVDVAFAMAHREQDFVQEPNTLRSYHPGTCMAVADFFGRRVSAYDGFWIMRKTGSGWIPVIIT